jgi:type I restriction enzyme, S subunit
MPGTSTGEQPSGANSLPTESELARREGRSYEPASVLLERILAERRSRWEAAQLAKMRNRGKDDSWKRRYKEPARIVTTNLPSLPEGWAWATTNQIAALEPNSITDGPFGSNLKTEHYTSQGPRVIRLQNVGNGVFIDEDAHISEAHYEKLKKHRVYANDLVIAALGERPPRSCVIPPTVGPAIVKADCVRFKPAPGIALVQYLNLVLNAEPTKTSMKDIVHGVGRPRLNLGEIKSIVLPLPPIIEQERIVADAERRLSILDEVEAETDGDVTRSERVDARHIRNQARPRLAAICPNT